LQETDSVEKILTHLNLFENNKPVNAALLLFGKQPQRFFISSEVRCVVFRGTIMEKPIPSYKVFKGTAFELVDQTVEYILSKLDYSVGTRETDVQAPGAYEIPKDVIAEAVVNAIAHRDYTNNGSVQVMLFRDRLEIWNPGSLPMGWTVEKLKQLHSSVPANPLMAEPLYLTAYIERLGTGTSDMVSKSKAAGLKEPQFIQAEEFRTVLYRPSYLQTTEQVPDKHRTSNEELPPEYRSTSVEVRNLIAVLENEMNRQELQDKLELKHEGNFRDIYLVPALHEGWVEMKYPQKNHPKQKYRLTEKGLALQKLLKNEK
jgi:predicted HTH transcriptional regulator